MDVDDKGAESPFKIVQIIIGNICAVDHYRGFLEALNATAGIGICVLTITPGLLQPRYTFSALVHTCTIYYTLRETTNTSGVHGFHRLVIRDYPRSLSSYRRDEALYF